MSEEEIYKVNAKQVDKGFTLGSITPKFSANINKLVLDLLQEAAQGCQFHTPNRYWNDTQHRVKPWLPEVGSYN